ncbi:MAG TPA: hypothetical protein VFX50_16240, partial [Gemmatimonadales bacterium]|nr:hypothetical protein [Gemmatimonadales bacterium]
TSDDGAYADTASVTITAAPPTLVAIELTPPTASVVAGGTVQFTAVGRLSDASVTSVPVGWSATGGSVTGAGLFTAGTAAGAFRVVATQSGGTLADTAEVTISEPPATLVSISISPDSMRIKPYDSVHVTATGHYSDGGTAPATVTWTSVAGTVSALGNFVAGTTTGRFALVATVQGGTIADTIPVSVHQTTGESVVGPVFWEAAPGAVYLCTSNQFTDDPVGLGGVAAITATGEGLVTSGVTFSTLGFGSYTSAGTPDFVKVVCEQVWQAPVDLAGTVAVTIAVTPARPGTGIANMFTYENPDPFSRPPGRGSFTQADNWYAPNWFTGTHATTVTVSATTGANVWYKVTYMP